MEMVVGVTGASGSIYARRALEKLLALGVHVHAIVTSTARVTWAHELGEPFDPGAFAPGRGRLSVHGSDDFFAPVASGSYRHDGMLVAPCSVKSLAEISQGLATNLLTRAADVCLKERRRLVLLVRETPLSLIHLENMVRVTRAGATVLPANPGFYHRPATMQDLVDFVVTRALDQFGLDQPGASRWGSTDGTPVAGPEQAPAGPESME